MIFSQILTNSANGVFEYLAKKAREGIYQPLTDALSELARVLTKLDPSNLNAILTNTKNGVLECLRKNLNVWLGYSLVSSLIVRTQSLWRKK
jgi:hypothetical protein